MVPSARPVWGQVWRSQLTNERIHLGAIYHCWWVLWGHATNSTVAGGAWRPAVKATAMYPWWRWQHMFSWALLGIYERFHWHPGSTKSLGSFLKAIISIKIHIEKILQIDPDHPRSSTFFLQGDSCWLLAVLIWVGQRSVKRRRVVAFIGVRLWRFNETTRISSKHNEHFAAFGTRVLDKPHFHRISTKKIVSKEVNVFFQFIVKGWHSTNHRALYSRLWHIGIGQGDTYGSTLFKNILSTSFSERHGFKKTKRLALSVPYENWKLEPQVMQRAKRCW